MEQQNFILMITALVPMLAFGGTVSSTAEMWDGVSTVAEDSKSMELDCRKVFPVAKLKSEPLAYSAIGWDLDPVDDPSRTVTISFRSGTFADGVFTPDGQGVEILHEKTGSGVFEWFPREVSKKVYRLAHIVKVNGVDDASAALYGYMDFSRCVGMSTQDQIEAAVLGESLCKVTVVQDADWPWDVIDMTVPRSGIRAPQLLPEGSESATTFKFVGFGRFQYDYALDGGRLEVRVDGETAVVHETSTDWSAQAIEFTEYGAHEVVFSCVPIDGRCEAGLRNVNVKVENPDMYDVVADVRKNVRIDLREGVRTTKFFKDILPLTYSSTNWIGDVSGATSMSVARVTVVELTGTDEDVSKWTQEVPSSIQVLKQEAGEGEVAWQASRGVWKATFDILNEDNSIHQESALFDLRATRANNGLVILLW